MPEERPIWGIHMEMHHGLRPITDKFVAIGWEAFQTRNEVNAGLHLNSTNSFSPMSGFCY